MASTQPIDPLTGPMFRLRGRLVLMDEAFTVVDDGVLYIDKGTIVAVQDAAAPPPPAFASCPLVHAQGTIFPGLIELHNHLAYNALTLWDVPKQFGNRNQWAGFPDYRKLISGPMQVIGKTPHLLPALIRYVECKNLLGGVTTSQGVQLFSNAGIRRFYRGLIRNVEQTDEAAFPEAQTRVADVEAQDAEKFFNRLLRGSCFLLHLSEGIDDAARRHFLALKFAESQWAIAPSLAGIHSTALTAADFDVMAAHRGATVWSPLSNLLLYGETTKIKDAKEAGVRIGLGSDWSPSGSKNLLGELKVARLVSAAGGGFLSDRDLVQMATSGAAAILKWEAVVGSLTAGKRADLVVVKGTANEAYATLIEAKETDIRLVMINGIARYGMTSIMRQLGAEGEVLKVGGRSRMVFFNQPTADPLVAGTSLQTAKESLQDALARLKELALQLEQPPPSPPTRGPRILDVPPEQPRWALALDELEDTGVDLRHHFPLLGQTAPTGATRSLVRASVPLSAILQPLTLDPLTVADDPAFLSSIRQQRNLPEFIKQDLKSLY